MCSSLVIVIIFIVIVICLILKRGDNRENYGFVMGSMGTIKNEYYRCISECEREDLSKKLGTTHGNLFCAEYCDSKLTDKLRFGEKKYGIITSIDVCNSLCGKERDGEFCRDLCFCNNEIVEKCRQECAYSTAPIDFCMQECQKTKTPNCLTLAWNFK